ncbi:MAG: hypothetical protein SGJ02_06785 [bacterium]|nr:hypothetical protein [bacterium]
MIEVNQNKISSLQLIIIASIGVILSILIYCLSNKIFLFSDTRFLSIIGSSYDYFPLTNNNSNAYHMWRLDPISHQISIYFGSKAAILFQLTIFFIFTSLCLFLLSQTSNKKISQYLIPSIISNICILILFGFDTVVIGSLAWIPTLICSYIYVLRFNASRIAWAVFLLTSILFAQSANSLSIPILIICIFAFAYLLKNKRKSIYYLLALFLLLPAVLVSFNSPSPNIPKLSQYGHFVPGYGTKDGRFPLIGPDTAKKSIDRSYLREGYEPIGIVILFLSITFFAVKRKISINDLSSQISFTALITGLCVLLDTNFISIKSSQIAPLASFSRLVPGLIFIPLTPIISGLCVFLLCIAFGINFNKKIRHLIWIIPFLLFVNLVKNDFKIPILKSKSNFDILKEVSTSKFTLEQRDLITTINSPSLYLLRQFGLPVMALREVEKNVTFLHISEFSHSLSSKLGSSELLNLKDKDPLTRVRLAPAPQVGGEWLHIKLDKAVGLSGISLTTDNFFSDFPRGLEIKVSKECSDLDQDFKDYVTISSYSDWQGPIHFSKLNLPFFGSQSDVTAIFTSANLIKCILISQISKDPNFDWSATELKLAVTQ